MRPLGGIVSTLTLAVGLSAVFAAPPLERCLDIADVASRRDCLEAELPSVDPVAVPPSTLSRLIDVDPALAERLVSAALAATVSARDRARLLDLRGQALAKGNRAEEAADSLRAAVELDDGNGRLEWRASDGRPAWSAALDPGEGRQERAAAALLASGRTAAARVLLAHALAAGARGSALEGWARAGGGPVPGLDASPSALSAATWYPPLPDLELRLLDGGTLRLSSARGKVLLLDFWASWCAPCLHELPLVQALADELRDEGLVAVTINARESVAVARSTAKALHLGLPVAIYDDEADRAFRVRSLPTIALVDREGRIRERWDRYVPDFDDEVAAKARALLAEKAGADRRPIAEVLAGGGALRVRWARDLAGPVAGLVLGDEASGGRRLLATVGDQLVAFRPDGSIATRQKLPPATAGRLRLVGPPGPALYDAVTFRPGRPDLVWLDTRAGTSRAWTAGSPLLDVAALPPAPPEHPRARLVMATLAGISVAGPDGPETPWGDARGETRAIRVDGAGAATRVTSLGADGTVRRFDASGRKLEELAAASGARGLVLAEDAPGALGVVTSPARGIARGRILPGGREHAAVALDSGQLVVVDLTSGSVPFRARFTGLDEVAAGDLDGDGLDEIVVAAGKTIAVLEAAARPYP